mgnify:CR=1 FL=1
MVFMTYCIESLFLCSVLIIFLRISQVNKQKTIKTKQSQSFFNYDINCLKFIFHKSFNRFVGS